MGSSSNFSPVLSFTCLLPFPEAFASTQSFLACPLLLRRNRHWLLEASCFLLNISTQPSQQLGQFAGWGLSYKIGPLFYNLGCS